MTKKTLSSEDSELFRQTIGEVRKIESDKILPGTDYKPRPKPKAKPAEPTESSLLLTDELHPLVGVEDSMSFRSPGLQHNVLKKLRQGQYGDIAEIDLHGLTGHEARRQLLNFLQQSIDGGYRCAHIIHGKGYRSADNHPVLKNHLNVWLRQHKNVLAFCSAPAKHGGTGAVFVLLKLDEKFTD